MAPVRCPDRFLLDIKLDPTDFQRLIHQFKETANNLAFIFSKKRLQRPLEATDLMIFFLTGFLILIIAILRAFYFENRLISVICRLCLAVYTVTAVTFLFSGKMSLDNFTGPAAMIIAIVYLAEIRPRLKNLTS